MTGPGTTAAGPRSSNEPVAIVGMAALPPPLDGADVDVARFGIPPAYAPFMARMELLMLDAAHRCLADAGYAGTEPGNPGPRGGTLPADRTDIVVGVCGGLDRQDANHLRVEGSRYARALERATSVRPPAAAGGATRAAAAFRALLRRRLGGSPHDRIGEMASSIPARIASAFRLRGRTLALESAEATSFVALSTALDALHQHTADAVLVLAGQRRESPLLADALAARGLGLGEGVRALLLKRLSMAVQHRDPIYAAILSCALRHDPRPGTLRPSCSVALRRVTARAAHRQAAVPARSVQYVVRAGPSTPVETAAETTALAALFADAAPASVTLGGPPDPAAHPVAHAGLAAVATAALALHHRTVPPHGRPGSAAADGADLTGTPFRTVPTGEPWPPPGNDAPRRAAVTGASLTGTLCHLLLEEHRPHRGRVTPPGGHARTRARTRARGTGTSEPIAVLSYGGRFAGSTDADALWRTLLTGADPSGPLPATVLDRGLYHAPGALGLTHTSCDRGAPVTVPPQPPPGLPLPATRYQALSPAQRLALAVAGELFTRRGPRVGPLRGPGLIAVGSSLGPARDRQLTCGRALGALEPEVAGLDALAAPPGADRERLLATVRRHCDLPDDPTCPEPVGGWLASAVGALIAQTYRLSAVPVAVAGACASALAAVDLAMRELRAGTVRYAVAGGVELSYNPRELELCSPLGLLSPRGITPFDTAADGFTPGDGCALFLLKRYDDARRDGDRVLGLLRGSGASNDARSLLSPDVDGQELALRNAFDQVDFPPAAVEYLEAHGAGTRAGDRTEVVAAARVYASARRPRPLVVGSVKSCIGHTVADAGGAGLLSVLLALRHRTLPPTARLRAVHPDVALAAIPAMVSATAVPWQAEPGRPRRAAVSSFGTGGINYHLLVEECGSEGLRP